MRILIGSDFVPTKSNFDLFTDGDGAKLFGSELLELLNDADYRVFNLETPLTDVLDPITKCGPNLSAPIACISGYKAAKVDLLTLANNHIMDQGVIGLQTTLETLEQNNIHYTGAGENLAQASKPFVIEIEGSKFGIYACAEHEFSIAEENKPGANPYDPLESFDAVNTLSKQCDYLIVLYHGGKENYRYPTPELQKRCRKFIEKGADLVICQHSHCIGCQEKYLSGTIVYGQGNFLFDHSDRETWQTGVLVSITDKKVSYIPLLKTGNTVRMAMDQDGEKILESFYRRSEEIKKPGFIEKNFSDLVIKEYYNYLEILSGKRNKFFYRAIKKLTSSAYTKFYFDRYFNKASLTRIENYIDCETHREFLLESLKQNRNGK